jgi:hypothetical protein
MPDNVQIRNFIEAYQGKTVHLTNGTSIRFTKAAAETALHLLSHRLPADEGGYHDVFPSISRLAEMAGKTERAIQLRLVQLERLGLIRRISRFRSDGRSTSNFYIFAIPAGLFQKQHRPSVDKKYQATQPRKSSSPKPCDPAVSFSRVRFTPPTGQPFTLKGDVDLKRTTTLDPTYLDNNYNHDIQDTDYQQSQTAAIPKPSEATPSEVVVFCSHFQATKKQKAALLRAVNNYGAEIVTEAIKTTMANIITVKLPFNYAIGAAARISQKQQYLAVLQQEKEARKIESERENIVFEACFHFRNDIRIFKNSSRAFARAVLFVTNLGRPDQRQIIESLSRRILSPAQDVA